MNICTGEGSNISRIHVLTEMCFEVPMLTLFPVLGVSFQSSIINCETICGFFFLYISLIFLVYWESLPWMDINLIKKIKKTKTTDLCSFRSSPIQKSRTWEPMNLMKLTLYILAYQWINCLFFTPNQIRLRLETFTTDTNGFG